ncbi:MAG: proline dehydrogenase family protein [Myxococcota bacterium]|jgi:proline dehydrogenase
MGIMLFMASRFVAGETQESAVEATAALNGAGVHVTLDILGEDVDSEAGAVEAADGYLRLLDGIAAGGVDANVSLKLTMMGLGISDGFCRGNVERILAKAAEHGNFVRVDMEGSAHTQRTLDLFYDMHRAHPKNVGIVLQSYLYRTENDIETAIAQGCRVRLCKGAYKEPAEVAFQDKDDVNAAYQRGMIRLLDAGSYPAIATHDEKMIQAAREHIMEKSIPPGRYEFQMLYGIRRDLQHSLASDGHNVRVYVPFGTAWFPYFYRRMRERKENAFFVLKHMFKG